MTPLQKIIAEIEAKIAINKKQIEEQRKPITDGKELFAPKCSSWWQTEPGVGRKINGFPLFFASFVVIYDLCLD